MQILVIDIEDPGQCRNSELRAFVDGLVKAKHGTVLVAPAGLSLVIHEVDDDEEHPKLGLKRDGQLYELEIDDA